MRARMPTLSPGMGQTAARGPVREGPSRPVSAHITSVGLHRVSRLSRLMLSWCS